MFERGVRLTGTDAWSWDAPFVHTAERCRQSGDAGLIWEGHKAGRDIGYCHLEKLHNLESLPAPWLLRELLPPQNPRRLRRLDPSRRHLRRPPHGLNRCGAALRMSIAARSPSWSKTFWVITESDFSRTTSRSSGPSMHVWVSAGWVWHHPSLSEPNRVKARLAVRNGGSGLAVVSWSMAQVAQASLR